MSSAEPRAQPAWQRQILERKRAKLAGAGGEPEAPAGERLVVAESLGPLRENPFMRLESERRRLRQGRPGPGTAARPLQQLLELYSAVPGIRTIRADNILIIESRTDPAACFAAGDAPPARRRDRDRDRDKDAAGGPDPLRELLARRGAALAEIRADQVVIYEAAEPPEAAEPGTVSRLLEKFGQRPRGRRRRGDALAGTGTGPGTGGEMKISFNETSLQTMFEYPSESSLAEEEEEEEGHVSETEEEKSCSFYVPCPNSTLHPSTPNSGVEVPMEGKRELQLGSFPSVLARILVPLPFGVLRHIYISFLLPADLSSYTPKHSVKFSEWQEQKYEGPAAEGPLPKEADSHGNQVMVRL
ncbi:hypothetical protein WISP_19642 [Willisornis vidua]|uniref:Taperin n=1 Tax=Willisornis vidua TaxID=1566151 RepID=A0ABQ9DNR2_9PASS|nr:hypothetical protein WISP_19642 [Willisornis vidua]